MKLAVTGATGLVGSRFFELKKSHYEIIPISSSFGVDITNRNQINKFLSQKKPSVILHFAAKTNVDVCEEDRENDLKKLKKTKVYLNEKFDLSNLDPDEWKSEESAFAVNVVGTKNLADYAQKNDIPIVVISTDFVFNGESEEAYTEEDTPTPVNWYGQTKFWSEKTLGENSLVTRISYPYGFKSPLKKDLVWTLVDLISRLDHVSLISDQIITPTFIDDVVNGLGFLIDKRTTGLVHLVGNNFISPYELGIILAREFGVSESKIELTTRAKLYAGRAARPFKVMLKNDKLRNLGFQMTDLFEALRKIKA